MQKMLTTMVLLVLAKLPFAQPSPCAPPGSSIELDINNVRAMIHNGGDLWWDPDVGPVYEIPKGSGKNSILAGAIWIGGVDASGQLKLAATRIRLNGANFWPGPLSVSAAETDAATCQYYDRHFKLNYREVLEFRQRYNDPSYIIPEYILNWPAHGDVSKGQAYYLAPFVDVNNDGHYDPFAGDYPAYDYGSNMDCEDKLLGEQTIWWVFNDKGNENSIGGNPIGLEVHAQAFAYQTSDAINDATFYQYKLINRSSSTLYDTWFGLWVDPDFGRLDTDFVGCDVQRGLGYAYNGKDDGSGGQGEYGTHPPAIGMDFLRGPLMNPDGKDNPVGIGPGESLNGFGFGDGIIDNERLGMMRFVYYNIDQTVTGNPGVASDYYNYLRGFWRDGTRMVYGGNGHQSSSQADPTVHANYMFPGNSDPLGWGTGGVPQREWTEITENNVPFDRRFVMSTGSFTLEPGAVNSVLIGVLWARDLNGNNLDAIDRLKEADDLAQQLADNCFDNLLSFKETTELKKNVSVFPNPFSDFAEVKITNESSEVFLVEVYNLRGDLVKAGTMEGNSFRIERASLPSGVYILKLSDINKRENYYLKKILIR